MSEDYVHGYSLEEQRRLTLMQTILNDEELRHVDLAGVRSILDVGAGLGQMTRALARAAGPGVRVVGVERDERQIAEAHRQAAEAGEADRVELRAGDATALPLAADEWGTFDLVHARFLLEHVQEPDTVVRQMARAVRPGGRVVLIDDDHDLLRLWPETPAFDRVWKIYWESYRDLGHDPLVGRRLVELLRRAGLRRARVDTVFYGGARGSERFDAMVDNLIGVVHSAADRLVAAGRLVQAELDAVAAELDAWRRQDAATLWYSLPLAEGTRDDPSD